MSNKQPKNLSASVRDRLMTLSRATKEPFQLVITRYALDRLLYRLSSSAFKDRFVLKVALLFTHWTGQVHRPSFANRWKEAIFRSLIEFTV